MPAALTPLRILLGALCVFFAYYLGRSIGARLVADGIGETAATPLDCPARNPLVETIGERWVGTAGSGRDTTWVGWDRESCFGATTGCVPL